MILYPSCTLTTICLIHVQISYALLNLYVSMYTLFICFIVTLIFTALQLHNSYINMLTEFFFMDFVESFLELRKQKQCFQISGLL